MGILEREALEAHLESYEEGYAAGYEAGQRAARLLPRPFGRGKLPGSNPHPKKKRKLSAWNKFVKANSKKPRFIYRNGKLNLKKMAVAFRKTPAGKKRKR